MMNLLEQSVLVLTGFLTSQNATEQIILKQGEFIFLCLQGENTFTSKGR